MKTMTLDEFRQAVKAQGVEREDYAFICPMCGTVQSARDLIRAGAGQDFEAVERALGFSCLGRYTNAGGPVRDSGKPCNWTLGGLLQTHELEVVTEDGKHHPHFAVATPEQAQAHAAKHAEGAPA
jgi:hypothetical protein